MHSSHQGWHFAATLTKLLAVECPECQHPLGETEPACPACGFALDRCDSRFGGPLTLEPGLADPDRRLAHLSASRVRAALRRFGQRFPQVRLTLLVQPCPPNTAPRAYLFWLFNRSGLASALERGGHNRHLLLWMEPETRQLSLMPGYGLEPLLNVGRLQDALANAARQSPGGSLATILLAAVREIDLALTEMWTEFPRIFGWFPEETWSALDDPLGDEPVALPSEGISY